MFENRSLKIQMVKDDKKPSEFTPYQINTHPVDLDNVVKKITEGMIKVIVVYISADTLRRVIVAAAKAKL